MRIETEVDFDGTRIKQTKQMNVKRAVKGTARFFEKVARPYVRWQTGRTSQSSAFSDFDKGEITYDTPYARYTYYNDKNTVTKDHNPNATAKWGDFVKAKYKKEIQDTFQRYLERG